MKKYLQLVSDGSIHSYHEDLLVGRDAVRFRVVECPADVDPHEHFRPKPKAAPAEESIGDNTANPASVVDDEDSAFPAAAVAAASLAVANEAPLFVTTAKRKN